MDTHAALLAAGRRRRWVLTAEQLARLGLDEAAIRHRVAAHRLHRKHPGVFAVGRAELSTEGRWLAATLACPDSVLSHFSAAALWGLVPATDGLVHVTAPTQNGLAQRDGVRVHRCESLVPESCTWRDGIPVTTLTRTLRDLAGPLKGQQLSRAVRQAEVLHRLDLAALAASLRLSPPNAARERRLLRVVERYAPGRVGIGLEEAVLELCVRGRLPLPVTQYPVAGYFVDFAWPDLKLLVEADDRWSHDTAVAFREDRARDRRLQALGFQVLRFTYAEVTGARGEVTRELRTAIRRAQESRDRGSGDV